MLPYVPDDSMIHECFSECKTLLRKRYFLPRIVQNFLAISTDIYYNKSNNRKKGSLL